MKYADYKRLGKISIKSRKKSTKNTVRGISFGLILIVSVMFLTLAVFVSFNSEINKIRTIATFSVESKNYDDPSAGKMAVMNTDGYVQEMGLISYASMQRIKNNAACEEYLTSNIVLFDVYSQDTALRYSLDGGAYTTMQTQENLDYSNQAPSYGIRINNLAHSGGKYYLDAEKEDLGSKPVFSAGGGYTEASGGKGEVLLTYNFAKAMVQSGSISTLIGKKFSLEITGHPSNVYIDDDADPQTLPSNLYTRIESAKIIQDFTIMGVLSEEFCSLPSRAGQVEATIWVSEKSVEYDDGLETRTLFPTFSTHNDPYNDSYSIYLATYSLTKTQGEEFARQQQIIFPYYVAMRYNSTNWSEGAPILKAINMVQGKNFKEAVDLTAVINAELAAVNPTVESSRINETYQNMAYTMFKIIFTALQVVSLVLFVFGGVLFVTSMLNLYNSLNYSVQARRNYLGMMRAIGAKDSSIPKMYLVEMTLIFKRTLLWVILFSFGICFGLRALIALLMKQAKGMMMGMDLSLNLVYYPISLFSIYFVVFMIAVFFALTACKGVSRKPILDILRTDI